MEYLDIVDENNVLTGEKRLRSEVHSQGLWHRTVHIYLFKIVENEIYFLIHLRAKNKDLYPNCWDTRFGGHIKSGENTEEAIKNELMEEVGLMLEQDSLIQGEIRKSDHHPNREFTLSFYYRFDGDITTLKFNDGEVQEIKWMKSSDILESMEKSLNIWSASKKGFIQVLGVLKAKLAITW
jgi:isopentenyldiphosphate isomerase